MTTRSSGWFSSIIDSMSLPFTPKLWIVGTLPIFKFNPCQASYNAVYRYLMMISFSIFRDFLVEYAISKSHPSKDMLPIVSFGNGKSIAANTNWSFFDLIDGVPTNNEVIESTPMVGQRNI